MASRPPSNPTCQIESKSPTWREDFQNFTRQARERRDEVREMDDYRRVGVIVAVDEVETLSLTSIDDIYATVMNYKFVKALIFAGRPTEHVRLSNKIRDLEIIELPEPTVEESESFFRSLLSFELPDSAIAEAALRWGLNPEALRILAKLTNDQGKAGFEVGLTGHVYDFTDKLVLPPNQIISSVSPKIVSATADIVRALKKHPDSIYGLPPRQFEELLADLLADMGWEVELTKATRDGGKDILAYQTTDIGRFLCLIEAKRNRRDRKVGVELVRSLFGTLCDSQANSAMLVTTSSFTKDAKEFQKKHEYKLKLSDYGDLVGWVQRYNGNGKHAASK